MRSTNDPITGLKARLIDWSVMAESDLKQLDKSAREEVDQAVEEAKQSPEPDPVKDLWTDVYFKSVSPLLTAKNG
jgi:pyruvate dehydrogenase E1 component alpha subunit